MLSRRSVPRLGLSLHAILFVVLLGVVWLAGGASRGDELGQVVVRGTAGLLLIVAILFGDQPDLRPSRAIGYVLAAIAGLALLQLCPLPPALWQALPGRAIFVDNAVLDNARPVWRAMSIAPGMTINAAFSLIVPLTAWVLLAGASPAERRWLPGLMLLFITGSVLVGLMQFSGVYLDNPFINDSVGQVSGVMANRNHFAVLLAIGCLLAPVWAFLDGRGLQWRGPVAVGLGILYVLTMLASGSRIGLLLGLLASVAGLILVRRRLQTVLSRYPRWVFPAMIVALVALIAIVVAISISADRAVSINRALGDDAGQDLRRRALPTVLGMIQAYFPVGSGLGTFDPAFRMHEPFELLKPTYFNHAHNDWLEVVLNAGLPGALLLAGVLAWWGRASMRAWRSASAGGTIIARAGSVTILLVMVASLSDYPARTPTIMVVLVIAAMWLADPVGSGSGEATLRRAYR